jgi:hypothetical protein
VGVPREIAAQPCDAEDRIVRTQEVSRLEWLADRRGDLRDIDQRVVPESGFFLPRARYARYALPIVVPP